MCEWESMNPGRSVAPWRSTTRVAGPRYAAQQLSEESTQTIVLPFVATHFAVSRSLFMVTIVPFS
jgi:hypothetical protein